MRLEDYPPQEPLSEAGRAYHAEVVGRGAGVEGVEDSYGPDPYQAVLLFPPPRPNGTVLALMHGGGWTSGYKEWMAFMAPPFAAAGVLVASIGYRLAPQHVFPTALEDCARAVAWIAGHAAAHGGDPKRLFLGGHSAGGHHAAWLAVRRDWQQGVGLGQDVVRGCLPISGVYDFGEGSGLSQRPRFLGPAAELGSLSPEEAASPIRCIQGPPPPFLMAHGENDFPHLVRQAEAMERALRAAGGDVERIVLPGRTHFSAHYAGGEAEGPWVPRALDWLRRH